MDEFELLNGLASKWNLELKKNEQGEFALIGTLDAIEEILAYAGEAPLSKHSDK